MCVCVCACIHVCVCVCVFVRGIGEKSLRREGKREGERVKSRWEEGKAGGE